jgi:hypothetical protein
MCKFNMNQAITSWSFQLAALALWLTYHRNAHVTSLYKQLLQLCLTPIFYSPTKIKQIQVLHGLIGMCHTLEWDPTIHQIPFLTGGEVGSGNGYNSNQIVEDKVSCTTGTVYIQYLLWLKQFVLIKEASFLSYPVKGHTCDHSHSYLKTTHLSWQIPLFKVSFRNTASH